MKPIGSLESFRVSPLPGLWMNLCALFVRAVTAPRRMILRGKLSDPRKVVILEPGGISDMLATQPLVKAFCENGYDTTVFARKEWAPMLVSHPKLTCEDYRPPWGSGHYRGRHLLSALSSLSSQLRPDSDGAIGIDTHGDIKSVILLYLAGCRSVYTMEKHITRETPILPGVAHRYRLSRDAQRWEVCSLFAGILKNRSAAKERPSMNHFLLSPRGSATLSAMKRATNDIIGIIPLATWEGREWFPDQWAIVLKSLVDSGHTPVVLCGPGECDRAMAAVDNSLELVREARDMYEWIHNISMCSGIISVNTGPMHIASILDKPTIVLNGPSKLPLWAPVKNGPNVSVICKGVRLPSCTPCPEQGDITECRRQCMASIMAADALAAINATL